MRRIDLEGDTIQEHMESLNHALGDQEFDFLVRQRMTNAINALAKHKINYVTISLIQTTYNDRHRWTVHATTPSQLSQSTTGEVLSWAVDSMDMLLRREADGRLVLPSPTQEIDHER